jgi:hypothetical protein
MTSSPVPVKDDQIVQGKSLGKLKERALMACAVMKTAGT